MTDIRDDIHAAIQIENRAIERAGKQTTFVGLSNLIIGRKVMKKSYFVVTVKHECSEQEALKIMKDQIENDLFIGEDGTKIHVRKVRLALKNAFDKTIFILKDKFAK